MWLLSSKVLVSDSGLLEGFRDCHCHLLPGVDDGVDEQEETMQILADWETLGVSEVWLTPHIMEDMPNEPEGLKGVFERLTADYHGDIRLHLAAEHMMDGLFLKRLAADILMPIGEEGTRLLVETSYYIPPMNMDSIIDRVKEHGYVPILAHPERYQYMDASDYRHWKEKGVRLQLNVPSLVGAYGPEVMAKARKLLERGMYDYCGSDTHSMKHTSFFLNSEISKKDVKRVRRLAEAQEL